MIEICSLRINQVGNERKRELNQKVLVNKWIKVHMKDGTYIGRATKLLDSDEVLLNIVNEEGQSMLITYNNLIETHKDEDIKITQLSFIKK